MFSRIAILGLVCCICTATVFVVWAKLKWRLPATTGPYHVATQRMEVAGNAASVPLQLWYPTEPRIETVTNEQKNKYPILLFAPGWGGNAQDSSALTSELASYGYIVAGFNDVGKDSADKGIGGGRIDLTRPFDLSSREAKVKSEDVANERVHIGALKALFVLDSLLKITAMEPYLSGRLNLEAIGFIGFSFGGAIAGETAQLDSRIKAVANLDGWLFGKAAKRGVPVPYLAIASAEAFPSSADLQAQDNSIRLSAEWCRKDEALHRSFLGRENFYWFLAEDARHEDFTDKPFSPGWLEAVSADKQSRRMLHQQLSALIISFLDIHLKQEGGALFVGSPSDNPIPLRQLTTTSLP